MDDLPQLVKILLAIPCLDIIWVVYRLIKSVSENDLIFIIIAALLIVVGLPWLWLVDIITLILTDNVIWFSSKYITIEQNILFVWF